MKKYRKKPIIIEAEQWLPCGSTLGENHYPEMPIPPVPSKLLKQIKNKWMIKTLEGWYYLTPYDYIIQGIQGEYYPCKPDIFEATYEKVEV